MASPDLSNNINRTLVSTPVRSCVGTRGHEDFGPPKREYCSVYTHNERLQKASILKEESSFESESRQLNGMFKSLILISFCVKHCPTVIANDT